MKIADELLNKYIDNELTKEELVEFNRRLSEDEKVLQRLKALQYVHQNFKSIKVFNAPANFTNRVMNSIISKKQSKAKKSYFFRAVISFFTFLIFSVSGLMIFMLVKSNYPTESKASVFTKMSQFFIEKVNHFEQFLVNPHTLIITSSITLLLMLSLYFIVESNFYFSKKKSEV